MAQGHTPTPAAIPQSATHTHTSRHSIALVTWAVLGVTCVCRCCFLPAPSRGPSAPACPADTQARVRVTSQASPAKPHIIATRAAIARNAHAAAAERARQAARAEKAAWHWLHARKACGGDDHTLDATPHAMSLGFNTTRSVERLLTPTPPWPRPCARTGCEKSTAHELSMYACQSSCPVLLSAEKPGTTSPRRTMLSYGDTGDRGGRDDRQAAQLEQQVTRQHARLHY